MTETTSLNSALHNKLVDLSEGPTGFSASELTGFSPEQVRRAAEALVKAGRIVRCKLPPRRVRYFKTEQNARTYAAGQAPRQPARPAGGARSKARWSADEPSRITPRTKIYIAPPAPRNVFRTNTYLQF